MVLHNNVDQTTCNRDETKQLWPTNADQTMLTKIRTPWITRLVAASVSSSVPKSCGYPNQDTRTGGEGPMAPKPSPSDWLLELMALPTCDPGGALPMIVMCLSSALMRTHYILVDSHHLFALKCETIMTLISWFPFITLGSCCSKCSAKHQISWQLTTA